MSATSRRNRAAARRLAKKMIEGASVPAQEWAELAREKAALAARSQLMDSRKVASEILLGAYLHTYGAMRVSGEVARSVALPRAQVVYTPSADVYEIAGAHPGQGADPGVANRLGVLVMLACRYAAEQPKNDEHADGVAFGLVEALKLPLLSMADPVKLGVVAVEMARRIAFTNPRGPGPAYRPQDVNPYLTWHTPSLGRGSLLWEAVHLLKPYLREADAREVERVLHS